jgi:hypothetical protein
VDPVEEFELLVEEEIPLAAVEELVCRGPPPDPWARDRVTSDCATGCEADKSELRICPSEADVELATKEEDSGFPSKVGEAEDTGRGPGSIAGKTLTVDTSAEDER